ncbi:MAG: hypothetical protein ISS81_04195 [Candidatus Marinimicrobia bacterium]|nr:hypothetical protein [Candidatus Neomarinimicrobiota bacterium]
MIEINKILNWGAELPFWPKVILSLLVTGTALFVLIMIWRSPNEPIQIATKIPPDSMDYEPSDKKQKKIKSAAKSESKSVTELRHTLKNENNEEVVKNDRTNQNTYGDNSPIILGDNNVVNIKQDQEMKPMIEGLTASVRQIPSPLSDAPFALEVVVQVQAVVSPVSIGFFIDKPLVEGKVRAPSPLFNFAEGTLNDDPKRSYWVAFSSPPITPTQPLIVHLMSHESFKITQIVRVNR